jgi:hypothetical protein
LADPRRPDGFADGRWFFPVIVNRKDHGQSLADVVEAAEP